MFKNNIDFSHLFTTTYTKDKSYLFPKKYSINICNTGTSHNQWRAKVAGKSLKQSLTRA